MMKSPSAKETFISLIFLKSIYTARSVGLMCQLYWKCLSLMTLSLQYFSQCRRWFSTVWLSIHMSCCQTKFKQTVGLYLKERKKVISKYMVAKSYYTAQNWHEQSRTTPLSFTFWLCFLVETIYSCDTLHERTNTTTLCSRTLWKRNEGFLWQLFVYKWRLKLKSSIVVGRVNSPAVTSIAHFTRTPQQGQSK